MDNLSHILLFLLSLSVLITVHELGHYLAGRYFGMTIEQFALGFGKPFFQKRDKAGTLWTISPFLIGGYVKFADSRLSNPTHKTLNAAGDFDQHPIYQRAITLLAGPVMNLVLGFLLFSVVFLMGVTEPKTIIQNVIPQTAASNAGLQPLDRIKTLDGIATPTWSRFARELILHAGSNKEIPITVVRNNIILSKSLDLSLWNLGSFKPNLLNNLGIEQIKPLLTANIGKIKSGSPADKSGLEVGDTIMVLDDEPIDDWYELVGLIADRPNQTLHLTVKRGEKVFELKVTTKKIQSKQLRHQGYLGISPKPIAIPPHMLFTEKYGFAKAISTALHDTYALTLFHFAVFGKLIMGKISFQTLGGPIAMAKFADHALYAGMIAFFQFIALINIMLACVNLLPVPGLDGGQLCFLAVESIRRKKTSYAAEYLWLKAGTICLVLIIIHATINDIIRWLT